MLEKHRRSVLLRYLQPQTLGRLLVRAVARAIEHDGFNIAQSASYSAIVALFPALIVTAAAASLLPDNTPLSSQLSIFFNRLLPANVAPLLMSYFDSPPAAHHSARILFLAAVVSLSGASGVIATLMEGFRRAHRLPEDCWTFWQSRSRALLLVPLSLAPLAAASLLVVFGHLVTSWLALHLLYADSVRLLVVLLAFLLRWTVALTGSIVLIALLYHLGTSRRQSWLSVLPGAIMATLLWFVATLAFGWYVTRFANYSQVYGSLGAGIALLFWLFLICLSVLTGAEFNVQFQALFQPPQK